ncbi:MAG: sulfite exporter TauE/SafE family protein [candidate division WOR-3 bacterium]
MTPTAAVRALLLGFASAPSCATLCLPVMTPLLVSLPRHGLRGPIVTLLLFSAGRLAGYAAVGLLAGLLGKSIPAFLFPSAYLLLGTPSILYGTVQSFPQLGLCRVLRPHITSSCYALPLGILAGINLCPPFLLAVSAAAELGQPLGAMLFFVMFFLGTTVWLLPLSLTGTLARFKPVQQAGRILAVAVGLWYFWLGISAVW